MSAIVAITATALDSRRHRQALPEGEQALATG
jgi:hypothetical protein